MRSIFHNNHVYDVRFENIGTVIVKVMGGRVFTLAGIFMGTIEAWDNHPDLDIATITDQGLFSEWMTSPERVWVGPKDEDCD